MKNEPCLEMRAGRKEASSKKASLGKTLCETATKGRQHIGFMTFMTTLIARTCHVWTEGHPLLLTLSRLRIESRGERNTTSVPLCCAMPLMRTKQQGESTEDASNMLPGFRKALRIPPIPGQLDTEWLLPLPFLLKPRALTYRLPPLVISIPNPATHGRRRYFRGSMR